MRMYTYGKLYLVTDESRGSCYGQIPILRYNFLNMFGVYKYIM